MKRLPTKEDLQEMQKVEAILSSLTPERSFELFQNSKDKCPSGITKQLLVNDDLYAKQHPQSGDQYSFLVEKQLMDGIQKYFRIMKGNALTRKRQKSE
ncbi:hypothetical protein [Cesiribacter sp. SM1]|uniref:hypothetical protein n=1 Tax=Cesiribacter sp. SM1 TaxID=2861196 RepID=UPI001CD30EF6|nr:hypothetical protein [Cesiribacter sp. SM1]